MDNNSYDGYDGDDPLGEASPTNLTNGSGGSTTLNPSNYGRGIDNQISSGDSALLLYVNSVQPVCWNMHSNLFTTIYSTAKCN